MSFGFRCRDRRHSKVVAQIDQNDQFNSCRGATSTGKVQDFRLHRPPIGFTAIIPTPTAASASARKRCGCSLEDGSSCNAATGVQYSIGMPGRARMSE